MENNETNVPRIIAMANMKGGVGKTTSTICAAIALNKLGRKVEVRDMDWLQCIRQSDEGRMT